MNVTVSEVVKSLANATITRRRLTGAYVAGVWTETAVDTVLKCVCQPVSGKSRDALPEGVRDKGRYVIHLVGATVRIDKAGTGEKADQVFYRGVEYIAVNPWEYLDHGNYNKIVLCTLEA
jgi:hypothetical protein